MYKGLAAIARRFYLLFQHHSTDAMLMPDLTVRGRRYRGASGLWCTSLLCSVLAFSLSACPCLSACLPTPPGCLPSHHPCLPISFLRVHFLTCSDSKSKHPHCLILTCVPCPLPFASSPGLRHRPPDLGVCPGPRHCAGLTGEAMAPHPGHRDPAC